MTRQKKPKWWEAAPAKPRNWDDDQLRQDVRRLLDGLPPDHPAMLVFAAGAPAVELSHKLDAGDTVRIEAIKRALLDFSRRRDRPDTHPNSFLR